jgi:hypothetical protein
VTGSNPGCFDVRQYSTICLKRLKKTMNIPIQNVAELSITTQWHCPLNFDAVSAREKHLERTAKQLVFKKWAG